MRKVEIELPDDYCNNCKFYLTYDPNPEDCTGFGGFRKYQCTLFNKTLNTVEKIHKKSQHWLNGSDEYKAKICKECKKKYK